jgi:hypothetical protein
MEIRPIEGAGTFRPADDQSTGQGTPERGTGRGRHRATGPLAQLLENAGAALEKRRSSTSARPEADEAARRPMSPKERYAAEIWECLSELNRVSSRRFGHLGLVMNRPPLSDPSQLVDALREGCTMTIGLQQGDDAAPDALLNRIIELIEVVRRGTKAEFVFKIQDPRDRARLEELWRSHLWTAVDGRSAPMPEFVEFTANEPWYPQYEIERW